jgi:hypothetical protein
MATWINNDGLRVRLGADEAGPARVTEITNGDHLRTVEVIVDADFLPGSAQTAGITLDSYILPRDAAIESISVAPEVETFASSGAATIQVRLVDPDGTDPDNLGTALSIANLNGQNSQVLDVKPGEKKMINLLVGTADFTAGKTTLRIVFSIPKTESDTLVWDKSNA